MKKLSGLLFNVLFGTTYQAIVVINEAGIIEQFNPAAERLFLFSAAEAIGQNVNILMGPPHREKHDGYLHAYLKTHVSYNIIGKGREITAQRKDGVKINIYISVNEIKMDEKAHFMAMITNVDEVFGIREELQKLAKFDSLTHAYSRGYFESHAQEWFEQYQSNQYPISLLILDLNGFKNVNDELGHNVGDQVLIAFAHRLQDCLSPRDYLVRLGGDEFLVVAQSNITKTRQLAHALLAISEKPYELSGSRIIIVPSIGVYAEIETTDLSLGLRRADFALYAAKKSIHLIQYFTQSLEEKFHQQRHWENVIREALIQPGMFYLLFQPQVDMHTKKVIGFEALLRLKHNNQALMPNDFIPIIESLGWGGKLNEMLLDKLLELLSKFQWNNSGILPVPTKIAFNLSPQVYNLKPHLERLLKKIDVFYKNKSHVQFEIEITESKLMAMDMKYPGQWAQISDLFKKYHVHLAIDDFSREYSSVYRLFEYHVSTLKIDKIFVDLLNGSYQKTSRSIIKALTTLGKELDITIMAEGIETKKQALQLQKLGCHIGQGFYFFHPLPPEEAFALVGVKLCSILLT